MLLSDRMCTIYNKQWVCQIFNDYTGIKGLPHDGEFAEKREKVANNVM